MPNTIDQTLNNYVADAQRTAQAVKAYCEHEDPEVRMLTQWLLTTRINPYSIFLDKHSGSSLSDIFRVESTFHQIEHAITDDGTMCFPVVNGQPYISFYERWDLVDRPEIIHGALHGRSVQSVSYLNDAADFIAAADAHAIQSARFGFVSEAARNGIEYAMKHFIGKPEFEGFFDESWLNGEALVAIEAKKNMVATLNNMVP